MWEKTGRTERSVFRGQGHNETHRKLVSSAKQNKSPSAQVTSCSSRSTLSSPLPHLSLNHKHAPLPGGPRPVWA
uniref:Uncharacterized protein n=1 Tax=Knipowitschia caucasica TaxID=637954 RepID=A0AAV2KLW5_KNICA